MTGKPVSGPRTGAAPAFLIRPRRQGAAAVATLLGAFAGTALLSNSILLTGLDTLAVAGELVQLLEATD